MDPYWFILGAAATGLRGLGAAPSAYWFILVFSVHAWEHRRTLAAGQDPEAELAFAGALLSRDFSNFSAWHHRLRLLAPARKRGEGEAGALPPERLKEGARFPWKNSWSFQWVDLLSLIIPIAFNG